jgi:hypothetical protein
MIQKSFQSMNNALLSSSYRRLRGTCAFLCSFPNFSRPNTSNSEIKTTRFTTFRVDLTLICPTAKQSSLSAAPVAEPASVLSPLMSQRYLPLPVVWLYADHVVAFVSCCWASDYFPPFECIAKSSVYQGSFVDWILRRECFS